MRKVILIQAGKTAWDEYDKNDDEPPLPEDERRLQGTVPLPLSENGKKALQDIARIVRLERAEILYSSGNESSGPTAVLLAELCQLRNKKMPDLRELDCGLWQGLRVREIKQRYGKTYRQWRQDPNTICPPQGEMLETARERVSFSLAAIRKKQKGKIVVIVAAPIVSALIECVLMNKNISNLWSLHDKNNMVGIFNLQENNDYCLCEKPSQKKIEKTTSPLISIPVENKTIQKLRLNT